MNQKSTRTLVLVCLALAASCLPNPVQAAENQPKMNKAIELLEEAKTAKNPSAVLEKAKNHVENIEPGDRGGRRYAAINKIEKAIAAVNRGDDSTALIDEAIVALQEGIEIKEGKKRGGKKGQ